MKYDVNVTRDGKWWMIEVPAINGLTQARRVDEVEDMARSLIAIELDVPASSVEFGRITVEVPTVGDVRDLSEQIASLKAQAARAEALAALLMRETAQKMAQAEVPLRDVGSVIGVSHQRVAQLLEEPGLAPKKGRELHVADPQRGRQVTVAEPKKNSGGRSRSAVTGHYMTKGEAVRAAQTSASRKKS